jgi:surface antigen
MKLTNLAALLIALGATGCNLDFGPRGNIRTVVGEAIGCKTGSEVQDGTGQLVAVGGGWLVGAFIGSEVGESLDEIDKLYALEAYEKAIETSRVGETTRWKNPDSGNSGTYKPTLSYRTEQRQYCREFTQGITVGGSTQNASGTACRCEDGAWEIVNN